MKEYVEEKKRERNKKMMEARRRRSRQILIVILVSVVFIVVLFLFMRSGFFTVKTVRITGLRRVAEEDVLGAAAIETDLNIFSVPSDEIIGRLLENPWISGALLVKHFPGELEIRITERSPAAQVNVNGAFYTIDNAGYVINKLELEDQKLPTILDLKADTLEPGNQIESEELQAALLILEQIDISIRAKIRFMRIGNLNRLTFYYDDVEIVFGEPQEIKAKSLAVKEILEKEKENVIFIDVRVPSNPAIRRQNP